jgi:hypothetical protein
MADDNSPQLGGQPSDDNAPMISGRGTKIIVSARGAYEARNLEALFNAMDADQQLVFRQAVIREMLNIIRPEIEHEAAIHPALFDFLRELDEWLNFPTEENMMRLYERQIGDTLNIGEPISTRIRSLNASAYSAHHYSIDAATYTMLYVPEQVFPQEPQWSIRYNLTKDWVIEVGWAILHGRNVPPLNLDAAHIETLCRDTERWYRRKDLPILIHLMTSDQRAQFKQLVQQQAMRHIETVPAERWTSDARSLIEQARQWLIDPSTLNQADYEEISTLYHIKSFKYEQERRPDISLSAAVCLIDTFCDESTSYELDTSYTSAFLGVTTYVRQILEGGKDWKLDTRQAAHQWQLDTAYAILTDQPIPPLGDTDDGGQQHDLS